MGHCHKTIILKKAIAGLTAAGMLGLTVSTASFAFDSSFDDSVSDAPVFGLVLRGTLDFSNFSVNGFTQRAIPHMSGSSTGKNESFFSIEDGIAKTQLPLASFGTNIKYPGIFYNQDGTQFYEYVANAVEGNQESQELLWPYMLGGAVTVGAILVLAGNSSSTDDTTPVVEDPGEPETPPADPVTDPPADTTTPPADTSPTDTTNPTEETQTPATPTP